MVDSARSEQDCRRIAGRIDSGRGDDAAERALIVFHTGEKMSARVAGWVEFQVSMPWRAHRALPPVQMMHLMTGSQCVTEISDPQFTAPAGDAERGLLAFTLRWIAQPLYVGGWDTYIAAYTFIPAIALNVPRNTPTADQSCYRICETLRRPGDLPPRHDPPSLSD